MHTRADLLPPLDFLKETMWVRRCMYRCSLELVAIAMLPSFLQKVVNNGVWYSTRVCTRYDDIICMQRVGSLVK